LKKEHNKLVRDLIPNIISDSGQACSFDILSEEDYITALMQKLNEEVAEYQADKSIEEMADVLEVLCAICEARGHSIEELMKVKNAKREKRGGFSDKIFWIGNEE
jgi:predicted house-cleaning noncanonical NTP pyrophosphatase (MazG superfamily)